MSFKKSWQNVEQRTFAFNKGAGDEREDKEIMIEIRNRITDCWNNLADGNPRSYTLIGYTCAEEDIAAILSDIMHLSCLYEWDIPGAMAARNTRIRSNWRHKQVAAQPSQDKTMSYEMQQRESQGQKVCSRGQGDTTRPRTRTSTR